jgi:hypothetical protein
MKSGTEKRPIDKLERIERSLLGVALMAGLVWSLIGQPFS